MESEIEEKLAQEARTEWQLTSRIFEWVWKRGVSGKSAIALVIFAIYAPLIVGLLGLGWSISIWFTQPLATNERFTLLAILLLTVDSVALWVLRYAWPNIIQWYFRKRRRRPLKETPA